MNDDYLNKVDQLVDDLYDNKLELREYIQESIEQEKALLRAKQARDYYWFLVKEEEAISTRYCEALTRIADKWLEESK